MPWPKVDFNVSHQAGLVTLVGVCVSDPQQCQGDVLIGCDIVAPHERADLEAIKATDFEDFTSTFAEIFSSDELWDISYNLPSHSVTLLNGQTLSSKALGRLDRTIVCDKIMRVKLEDGRIEEFISDLVIDAKLRRFYTFFCLKEAYIKLIGEGLLAPWIKECEFKNVRAPTQGTVARCSTHGTWGGRVHGGRNAMDQSSGDIEEEEKSEEEDLEVWLNGEELPNVRTEVQAYEENYMIATMIKPSSLLGSSIHFPKWERVNLEKDILDVARKDTKKVY
jgi:4'-phosphopantetheinyl transferase